MIFAPFDLLSDGDSSKPIHCKIKTGEYKELGKEDFSGDAASIQRCAETGKGFVARYADKLGMVFFSQNDIWYEWFDRPDGEGTSYWWTEDSFIGGVEDGQCYFVPYTQVLDMHKWGSYEELIVPLKSVKVLLDKEAFMSGVASSSSSKGNAQKKQTLPPPTSIMKGSTTMKGSGKQAKSVKIEHTPADALPRGRGNVSEGATTGGTISSEEAGEEEAEEMVEEQHVEKESNPRVEGPSDRSGALSAILNASTRRGAQATSQPDKHLEKEKTRLFSGYWSGMRQCMNWRNEWGNETLMENNFYMTPHSAKLNLNKSIENLEFFHSQGAMLQHIEDNPCLTYEWKAVWPMLKEAGWSQVTGTSAAKKVQYIN